MPPKANMKAKLTKTAPAAPPPPTRRSKRKADEAAPAPTPPKKVKPTPSASKAAVTSKKRKSEDDAPAPRKTKAQKKEPVIITKTKAIKKEPVKKAPVTRKPKAQKQEPVTTTKTKAPKKERVTIAPVTRRPKALKKGPVINTPPTERLDIYVFGEGTAGELGLGTKKNAVDVKRPRLNPNLAADTVGVVQIAAGGMHVIALTHDNKILTWGVNDGKALGRTTVWEGGLKDMDAPETSEDEDDDDDDDNGLNPKECLPGEVDWSETEVPEGTRFVQVAAGDSCSFALTDDGQVYGWGTFRYNDGSEAFSDGVKFAERPVLVPGLKKITSIKAGANHALALDASGSVISWGCGEQNQLGRRVVERTKAGGLVPRSFGLPKGPKNGIKMIESGAYHSFAISKNGSVYGWGLNNVGETGIFEGAGQDEANVPNPQVVEDLKGKIVVSLKAGAGHSLAATEDGECYIWGKIIGHQMGIADEEIAKMPEDAMIRNDDGRPAILKPSKVTAIQGVVTEVAASSDQSIAVTKEGKAWSWGFSTNYQTGQGTMDEIEVATLIDNTAVREAEINGASMGGQFSILTALAD